MKIWTLRKNNSLTTVTVVPYKFPNSRTAPEMSALVSPTGAKSFWPTQNDYLICGTPRLIRSGITAPAEMIIAIA